MQIDWDYIQANWDWAGHIVEAFAIAAVVGVLMRPLFPWSPAIIVGLAFAAGHFHGREKRDFEINVHMLPPHLRGYLMWDWNWDQVTDFWPAAFACFVALLLVRQRK
ncbi:hypothetical protein [Shinella sp.]|uniref:hypothetical protein n=1 Tax=Shinella sp. TaxID=1870904 RepID=UPI00289B2898|nr:hypothetical protein [Shinella sp.]